MARLLLSTLYLAARRYLSAISLRIDEIANPVPRLTKANQFDFPDNLGSTILHSQHCHRHRPQQWPQQLSQI